MQIKDSILVALGIVGNVVLGAPVGEDNQVRQGIPFMNQGGNGLANANLVLGGGLLPTLTIAGAMAGGNNQVGIGASRTFGIGGGALPTALAGGGFGLGIDSNNVIAQNSGTFSQGGYLNGIIPTFQAGMLMNNQLGYSSANGANLALGNNGGGSANLEYGGNFISKSTLNFSLGGGFAANFQNGPASPTGAQSATLASASTPAPSPSPSGTS